MKIIFFTKGGKQVASSRHRVWFVAEELNSKYGITYKIISNIKYSFFSFSRGRLETLKNIWRKVKDSETDLLFIHKSIYPADAVFTILLASLIFGKKFVYDLDDAEWKHSKIKTVLLMKTASVVFCGSHEIKRWANKYNSKTVLIPTAVHHNLYLNNSINHQANNIKYIGWLGQGMAHFKSGNFKILKDALNDLYKKGVKFKFIIIGSENYDPLKKYFNDSQFKIEYIDNIDWEKGNVIPAVLKKYELNIGLMPIVDNSFNKAKCAFKAIQYMASGIPAVVSDVGESSYVINNGINGFLSNSVSSWSSNIEKLIASTELRIKMGKAGQKAVKEKYSYDSIVPLIKKEIDSL